MKKISQPFQLLKGGYLQFKDENGGWQMVTAQLPTSDKMALLRPGTC